MISNYECRRMQKQISEEVGYCNVHGDWSTRELGAYNWNEASFNRVMFKKIQINRLPLYKITLALTHRYFNMVVHCVFCSETHIRQAIRPLVNLDGMHEEENCYLECEDYIKDKDDDNDK